MNSWVFKKIELWAVLLLLLLGIIASILFASAVRDFHVHYAAYKDGFVVGKLGPIANEIAAIPRNLGKVFRQVGEVADEDLATREQRFEGESGFLFKYGVGERPDLGYALIARYDGDRGYSVVELVDLNLQKTMHSWDFSMVAELWKRNKTTKDDEKFLIDNSPSRFLAKNPVLTEVGDIYVHETDSPIVKADLCSNLDIYQEERGYHHSLEYFEGEFWSPFYVRPKTVEFGSGVKFEDDGIAWVGLDRNVLLKKSLATILEDNGLDYLLYGYGEHNVMNPDPFHLNDIQPVYQDGPYWNKGDVFLSLRNMSTLMLYRPKTNEIVWHKTGPWFHQHDVNVLNDKQISVFNNNVKFITRGKNVIDKSSNILVYDFESDEVTSPFQEGFESLDIRAEFQGRGRIIGDEAFVEETPSGRVLQFGHKGDLVWQFVNRSSDGKVYYLSWSRYIDRQLGDQVLKRVQERGCE